MDRPLWGLGVLEMLRITLIPLNESGMEEPVGLDLPATIGRGREAEVRLDDPFVSRIHCQVYELEGKAVVRDLHSKNGTFVNGHAITETIVMPEELLRVGGTRFLVAYAPLEHAVLTTPILAGEDKANGHSHRIRGQAVICD